MSPENNVKLIELSPPLRFLPIIKRLFAQFDRRKTPSVLFKSRSCPNEQNEQMHGNSPYINVLSASDSSLFKLQRTSKYLTTWKARGNNLSRPMHRNDKLG